ncbi:MAG: Uma2 family endonuclease [Bacillota bacterium]
MQELLTAKELAEILSMSVETIWRYTRQGKIPALELGPRQYRYDRKAVVAALAAGDQASRAGQAAYPKESGYTYADYLRLPEEPGYRYELLGGQLVKEPSPSTRHQIVSLALGRELLPFFDQFDPEGQFLFAPVDVTLSECNVVQPDILFVSKGQRRIMREERIDGPPLLVIEIISPATRRKDRLRKLSIYRAAGVTHYWLVDTEEDTLEAFALRHGGYALVFAGSPGDEFGHPDFPGLTIDLARVFRRPVSAV